MLFVKLNIVVFVVDEVGGMFFVWREELFYGKIYIVLDIYRYVVCLLA